MGSNLLSPLRRQLRPVGKSFQAMLRWRRLRFDEAPVIFGNAKPKSGSHLLLQVLGGFTRIMPYLYVEAQPVRTITPKGVRRDRASVAADLRRVPRGVIGWGYVEATPENLAVLCKPGRVNYFMYRDPRAVLVSEIHFAMEMHETHRMRAYFNRLPDFGARLTAAIRGVDEEGAVMVNVLQRYAAVFEWFKQEQVMCIRFEDMIEQRDATLNAMLDQVEHTGYHLPVPRDAAIRELVRSIQPSRSRTFRSGKTSSWREQFTPAHKKLFLDVAGDLLIRLGYETNNDW